MISLYPFWSRSAVTILDIAEEARLLSMTFKGPICPCAINGKANITVVKRINDFMADCFADVA
jgi:hypothetical protein